MEVTSQSLSYAKLMKPPSCSGCLAAPFFHSKLSVVPCQYHLATFPANVCLSRKLKCRAIRTRNSGAVRASEVESGSTENAERWLFEPVGDGDCRHIGYKVPIPGAFEIFSQTVVTVGRVPEKADIVIPVATVSALHARLQKREESILVTDLDSTNGTFVDETRLRPGVATPVSPGRSITFGDTHLAIFKVSKLVNVGASEESEESEVAVKSGDPSSNSASTD